jgi:hypothetical protein
VSLADEAIESIYRYDENRLVGGIPAGFRMGQSQQPRQPAYAGMSGYAVNLGPDAGPLTIDITGEVSNGDIMVPVFNNNHPYTTRFQPCWQSLPVTG